MSICLSVRPSVIPFAQTDRSTDRHRQTDWRRKRRKIKKNKWRTLNEAKKYICVNCIHDWRRKRRKRKRRRRKRRRRRRRRRRK